MKTLAKLFTLLTVFTIIGFTSCKNSENPTDEPANPTINFVTGDNYTSSNVTLEPSTTFTVCINASSNAKSKSKLVKFKISRVMNNIPVTVIDSTISTELFTYLNLFQANDVEGVERWAFSVTDKEGNTKEISFNVTTKIQEEETDLDDSEDFAWERVGSNAGKGLDEFGLQWTSNTSTHIEVKPMTGTKLVQFTVAQWTSITTKEGLADAVEKASSISKFSEIPTKDDTKTFNYVLGTKKADGTYYLINATKRVLVGSDNRTVTGKYRK